MKLYRFRYSPYARKVQMLLELAGLPHEVIEVRYGERARFEAGARDGIYKVELRFPCESLRSEPRP